MQQYMEKTRLGGTLDALGLRLLIIIFCILWFIWLWGVTLPAIVAGIAFSALVGLAIRLGKKRTVTRREQELRQRIGGEIAVEELPLSPERQTHFQAALWLTLAHPLRMERITNDGVLCRLEEELVLVRCISRHSSVPVTVQDVIEGQRACILHRAQKCVLCTTSPLQGAIHTYIGQTNPPVKVVSRDRMIRLAGIAAPATDAQLVALGSRKRRQADWRTWLNHILSPHRSRRYLLYGMGLLAMYLITRLAYYPVPAAICLSLSVLSKLRPQKEDTL